MFALIFAHLAGQRQYVTIMPMRAIGALPEMEIDKNADNCPG
jgi:hypothetical protein